MSWTNEKIIKHTDVTSENLQKTIKEFTLFLFFILQNLWQQLYVLSDSSPHHNQVNFQMPYNVDPGLLWAVCWSSCTRHWLSKRCNRSDCCVTLCKCLRLLLPLQSRKGPCFQIPCVYKEVQSLSVSSCSLQLGGYFLLRWMTLFQSALFMLYY